MSEKDNKVSVFFSLSLFFKREFLFKQAANIVTMVGFILAGFAVALLWINPEKHKLLILFLSFGTAISDNLDGRIAKKLGTASQTGSDLDKGRDKFFICNIFIWLIIKIIKDVWIDGSAGMIFVLTIIVFCLIIEILLVIRWIICRIKKIDASARKSGQIKMGLYFAVAIWWFLCWNLQQYISEAALYVVFCMILLVALVFAYFSLQTYHERYAKAMKERKKILNN